MPNVVDMPGWAIALISGIVIGVVLILTLIVAEILGREAHK
jgi:hypothetical protein